VDIVTFASQCEKTYAKSVEDAYMMEFEQQKDSSAETAKGSNRPKKLVFKYNFIVQKTRTLSNIQNYSESGQKRNYPSLANGKFAKLYLVLLMIISLRVEVFYSSTRIDYRFPCPNIIKRWT